MNECGLRPLYAHAAQTGPGEHSEDGEVSVIQTKDLNWKLCRCEMGRADAERIHSYQHLTFECTTTQIPQAICSRIGLGVCRVESIS